MNQKATISIITLELILLSAACTTHKLASHRVEIPQDSVTTGGGPYFITQTNGRSVTVTKLQITAEGFEIHEIQDISYHRPQKVTPYLIRFENIESIKREEQYWKKKSKWDWFLDGFSGCGRY